MTDKMVEAYLKALESEERAAATIAKYRRALLSFATFLSGAAVTLEIIRLWKDDLREKNYAPSTINTYLAALNGFFRFCGWADCRARFLKIQRRLFRDSKQELTRGEYERLVAAAEAAGDRSLALLMETICSTGIRVSEVQYITVEAARNGKTEIALKGKIRTILLPSKLCRKLLKFAARQKTASGAIFRAKSGKALSRYQIWSKMKKLCARAGVDAGKRSFRTTCAICSQRRFTAHTRRSSSSRTFSGIRASRRRAFTLSQAWQSIGDSSNGYSSYHKKGNCIP